MKASSSKSKAMVLKQKKLEWSFRDWVRVPASGHSKLEWVMDRRIGALSAVMRVLLRSVVEKRELSWKAKLSVYWSIFVPTLTYGDKIRVMIERMRLKWVSFRGWPGWALGIGMELGVGSLPLSWGGSGIWQKCLFWAYPTVRRDYISRLAWERLRIPQEELESVAGERDVWVLRTCCLRDPTLYKRKIMNGWTDGHSFKNITNVSIFCLSCF